MKIYQQQGVYNFYLKMKDDNAPTVAKNTTTTVPTWHP